MNKIEMKVSIKKLMTGLILIAGMVNSARTQELRWIRIGQLQSYFMDYGSECELTVSSTDNFFAWPIQYGDQQYTIRMKALWLGAKDFYDPVEKKQKGVKVVGAGPRYDAANQPGMIFPQPMQLIGRFAPSAVVVDNQTGTNNTLYDVLDDQQDNLPCDRMVIIKFNTSMGVSVTKKVLGFVQQNHDDYFIYDYVFKNTGKINKEGEIYEQALKDFWIYFNYRYAFSGVTSTGYGSTWGAFASEWGISTVFTDFGPYNGSDLRGFYCWYGPCKDRQDVSYEQDWGCPNHLVDGLLGSAKYAGVVTLFASKSPGEYNTDDPNQPATTAYIACDGNTIMESSVSQYDEIFMNQRYDAMTEGHLPQTHAEAVGDAYTIDWASGFPERDGGGGTTQGQGFGPYQLGIGDSIRIVFAEGVNGLSWPMCRKVGANWFAYYKGTGQPELKLPDGTSTNSYTDYTRAWVETGADSIMQTLNSAVANYNSGYNIPQPPAAPATFTVTSGGDRIRLSWSNEAETDPHFDGYVIYRSEGNVKKYNTYYDKIFECNKSNSVNEFDDMTAVRGFNYYYYIQSKDDGTQNDIEPGVPLYSSLFMTMTSVPAYLRRPAVTKAEKATPDADTTYWELNVPKEEWTITSIYNNHEIISYNGSNYLCIHDSTTGTEPPTIDTRNWKLIKSRGEWNPAKTYVAADAILYNDVSYVCLYGISGGTWLDLVRVVPNPYDIRSRMYQFGEHSQYDRIAFYGLPPICDLKVYTERGDLIWSKKHTDGSGDELWDSMTSSRQIVVSGIYILYVETPEGESVFRKFVVIR
jgi:hypothetical protein